MEPLTIILGGVLLGLLIYLAIQISFTLIKLSIKALILGVIFYLVWNGFIVEVMEIAALDLSTSFVIGCVFCGILEVFG